jgi:hypothetical protein
MGTELARFNTRAAASRSRARPGGYWWWQSEAGTPEKRKVPQWKVLAASSKQGDWLGSRTEESGSGREKRQLVVRLFNGAVNAREAQGTRAQNGLSRRPLAAPNAFGSGQRPSPPRSPPEPPKPQGGAADGPIAKKSEEKERPACACKSQCPWAIYMHNNLA